MLTSSVLYAHVMFSGGARLTQSVLDVSEHLV